MSRGGAGAGARLHRATMCARGAGAYDIGRDGTGSGGRAQAHSCERTRRAGTLSGVLTIGRIGGDYAADYDAARR